MQTSKSQHEYYMSTGRSKPIKRYQWYDPACATTRWWMKLSTNTYSSCQQKLYNIEAKTISVQDQLKHVLQTFQQRNMKTTKGFLNGEKNAVLFASVCCPQISEAQWHKTSDGNDHSHRSDHTPLLETLRRWAVILWTISQWKHPETVLGYSWISNLCDLCEYG